MKQEVLFLMSKVSEIPIMHFYCITPEGSSPPLYLVSVEEVLRVLSVLP